MLFERNIILTHRARRILEKVHDAFIQSNLISGSSMAGLVMQSALRWGEGKYSERIPIRNNTFMKCGYATSGSWTEQADILTIYGHHTLTIENNMFFR
ncbi:unnamed protein product [Adineta steineri]|uniref:Uncharacterized protein n=1 Tax=Adineta steineri TaxID=433720 RepID=A0A814N807_9BILA|nr:unnamed protein product [Adineta steineri]CAF1285133.1 unnamed protein product [Adineta steineri]